MKLTMGFIGFGKSANRYHLPYVLIRENIKVKTIFDIIKKPEVEQGYKKHNINFTQDVNELLKDPEIKLVTVCTHPDSHYKYAKLCLENGKNVMVEKPFCTTTAEAEEIFKLAKEKGLIAMPFQNRRFDSDFLAVKEVLEKGYLGDIVEIESHFDYYRTDNELNEGSYFNGAFYGLGIHTLDQIISLFGRPKNVFYDIRSIRNPKNPDDLFAAELFYDNFKAIIKTNHLVKIDYPKFIVHGKNGSFIKYGIDQQENCLKAGIMPQIENFGKDPESSYGKLSYIDENGNDVEKVIPTPQGDYGRVYDSLYESIINGKEKLVSDEEALTNMEILERGFEGENPRVIKL